MRMRVITRHPDQAVSPDQFDSGRMWSTIMRMRAITCHLDQAVSPDLFDSGRMWSIMNECFKAKSHVTLTRLFASGPVCLEDEV